ncbi:MAG: DUF4230 domain-containing protein [Muribaculaceae bacterium]|nr:DUF4230 domain-containing protein [Roseburia sp.]MCM1432088.1 DUF4230 domain-containing protein [Muribaculaceae bacterium]MCM1492112.1 DUF4230 domain-containing protein [Muribaculaceae bacterium]
MEREELEELKELEELEDLEETGELEIPEIIKEKLLSAAKGGKIWIILIFLTIITFASLIHAKEKGTFLGTKTGKAVGMAVGSASAFTEGIAAGAEAGKAQGLSAEDTDVAIGSSIQGMGRLQVLTAETILYDDMEYGTDYKALVVHEARVVFSVDLKRAEISQTDAGVVIVLPPIEADFIIDDNDTKNYQEWQKYFWSGDTKSGYDAYMNSMARIRSDSRSAMRNYEYLEERAEKFAVAQIEKLVASASVQKKEIHVEFRKES